MNNRICKIASPDKRCKGHDCGTVCCRDCVKYGECEYPCLNRPELCGQAQAPKERSQP